MPPPLPGARWALTPPFHPYLAASRTGHRRSVLCGTFRRVALTGRYPAPCPMELGLSSTGARPAAVRTCFPFCETAGVGTRRPSAPVRTRTSNLLIRSQMLYPIELRARTAAISLPPQKRKTNGIAPQSQLDTPGWTRVAPPILAPWTARFGDLLDDLFDPLGLLRAELRGEVGLGDDTEEAVVLVTRRIAVSGRRSRAARADWPRTGQSCWCPRPRDGWRCHDR